MMRPSSERLLSSSKTGVRMSFCMMSRNSSCAAVVEQIGEQFLVVEQQIVEPAVALRLVELVAFQRADDRAEQARIHELGKDALAFLAQPEQGFGGDRVLADGAVEAVEQRLDLALFLEQAGGLRRPRGCCRA